jgi:N-acetylglutamate synthase-like GNAT family acetyltransferase
MNNIKEYLLKYNSSLLGSLYTSIDCKGHFYQFKSTFKDKWYNFIVPVERFNSLDWKTAFEIISSEAKQGYKVSFYVDEDLIDNVDKTLVKSGYEDASNDTYMTIKLRQIEKGIMTSNIRIKDVDTDSVDILLEFSKICFPEWENNVVFSRYFFEHSKFSETKISKTYLAYLDSVPVGFCSAIYSLSDKMTYYHNIGVLPKYRRKGICLEMVRFMSNEAKKLGCEEAFSLVEDGSGSFNAFTKLGFVKGRKFHVFVKVFAS